MPTTGLGTKRTAFAVLGSALKSLSIPSARVDGRAEPLLCPPSREGWGSFCVVATLTTWYATLRSCLALACAVRAACEWMALRCAESSPFVPGWVTLMNRTALRGVTLDEDISLASCLKVLDLEIMGLGTNRGKACGQFDKENWWFMIQYLSKLRPKAKRGVRIYGLESLGMCIMQCFAKTCYFQMENSISHNGLIKLGVMVCDYSLISNRDSIHTTAKADW